MIILRGWNPFYEGWLAGIFQRDPQPPARFTPVDQDSWREGWNMAVESADSPHMMRALRAEIALGHVIVRD